MKEQLHLDLVDGTVTYSPWPRIDTSGTLLQVQFAGHEYLGPSYYVHREHFESYLLCFTTKGHTNVLVDNELYCAGEGTLLFYDCMRSFTSTTDAPRGGEPYSAEIHFLHLYPNDLVKQFCKSITADGPVIAIDTDYGFRALCEALLNDLRDGTVDELAYSVRIYELLCRLQHAVSERSPRRDMPSPVRALLHHIAEHYGDELSLAACARLVSLSPNYLSSLFAAHVGMTPSSYVADVRFHKSTEMLLNTSMSLEQIAEAVGLGDARALIRLYRKKVDMTPCAYRRYYRRSHPTPVK